MGTGGGSDAKSTGGDEKKKDEGGKAYFTKLLQSTKYRQQRTSQKAEAGAQAAALADKLVN